jgi:hypothetical protein
MLTNVTTKLPVQGLMLRDNGANPNYFRPARTVIESMEVVVDGAKEGEAHESHAEYPPTSKERPDHDL